MPFFSLLHQLEEQLSRLQREKNDLQSRMEEDQEDLNELMKKHKVAISQVCTILFTSHFFVAKINASKFSLPVLLTLTKKCQE